MRNILLFSVGALALAGCDFAGSTSDIAAPIASLQASALPTTPDADGTAPDVFFEIQDAGGRTIYRSDVATDADISQGASAAISEAITVRSSTMGLQVAVFDFDGSFQNSRRMARSLPFTVDELAATPSISLGSNDGSTTTQFTVTRGTAQ